MIKKHTVKIGQLLSGRLKDLVLKKPEQSFTVALISLMLIIVTGNYLRRPAVTENLETTPKKVKIFTIGETPTVKMTARVEKSGVVKVTAQSGGVVQKISVSEGMVIKRGTIITSLSTNYQGGNLPSVSRQLAATSSKFADENFDTQKTLIEKRREAAEKLGEQAVELRRIADASLGDTRGLITLNEDLLQTIDEQIAYLESTNDQNNSNGELIFQAKQGKAGLAAAILTLRSGLRQTEYQANEEKPAAALAGLTREITLKGLELEEKSLELNREIARLNLRIAQIAESLMYPSAPINGTVERIFVKPGQTVNPGQLIAVIAGSDTSAVAVVLVGHDLVNKISRMAPAKIFDGSGVLEIVPDYISREPTDGILHTILYPLPEETAEKVHNGGVLMAEIPLGMPDAPGAVPFIPIDSVFQSQNAAFVYVASDSATQGLTAQSRTVSLGPVTGSFVEILNGINPGDRIITSRNILNGDSITF